MKTTFKRALSLILVLLFSVAAGFAEGLTVEPLSEAGGAVSGGVEPEPEPEGEFMLGDPDGAPALGSDEAPIAGSDSDADGVIEANAAADENSEKIIYFDPSKNLGQSVPDGYSLLSAVSRA